jgi:iron-sulfur cluster repair protein YtfE (RIC family)
MLAMTEERLALPDFLTGFMAIHDAMRRDATRLAALDATLAAPAPRATGEQLRRWWAHVEAAIVHHHEREDDLLWPDLMARRPAFAERHAQLEADHDALDEAMLALHDAFAAMAAGDDDPAARHAAVAGFATLLDEHLRREEAAAFPLIAEAYTAEEYAVIEKAFAEGSSIARMAFELPWVLDGTGAELDALVAELLPAPIRLLNRLVFTTRYRRIAAPLLSVAP